MLVQYKIRCLCTYNVYLRLTNSSEPQRVQVAVLLKLCAEKTVLVSLLPNLALVGGEEGITVSAFNGINRINATGDEDEDLCIGV